MRKKNKLIKEKKYYDIEKTYSELNLKDKKEEV